MKVIKYLCWRYNSNKINPNIDFNEWEKGYNDSCAVLGEKGIKALVDLEKAMK